MLATREERLRYQSICTLHSLWAGDVSGLVMACYSEGLRQSAIPAAAQEVQKLAYRLAEPVQLARWDIMFQDYVLQTFVPGNFSPTHEAARTLTQTGLSLSPKGAWIPAYAHSQQRTLPDDGDVSPHFSGSPSPGKPLYVLHLSPKTDRGAVIAKLKKLYWRFGKTAAAETSSGDVLSSIRSVRPETTQALDRIAGRHRLAI